MKGFTPRPVTSIDLELETVSPCNRSLLMGKRTNDPFPSAGGTLLQGNPFRYVPFVKTGLGTGGNPLMSLRPVLRDEKGVGGDLLHPPR